MNNALAIYAILMKHSDKEHALKQAEIRELLRCEYGLRVDRETVRRAIEDMLAYDLPISCKMHNRNATEFILTSIYYDKELIK